MAGPASRREGIDFWRGVVLCTIFVNHVPGNLFERLTSRNFGFSDSSEAFVFLSGLSLALAYGGGFASGSGLGAALAATAALARRAVRLYAVHVALSLGGIALLAAGAELTGHRDLMLVHGRGLVVDDPTSALVGLVSLGHQFGYFNILPLYVLLVGIAPVLFLLARLGTAPMLAASFGLYLLSRLTGLNVPTWPMRGTWFFDPFAWQFLMAVGIAIGLRLRTGAIAPNRWLFATAATIVAVAAVCATDALGAWPGLNGAARSVADLDKTTLGTGRIVHFLCLAYCVSAAGVAGAMRSAPWHGPLCLIGRNGLAMFVLLSLLAAIGQIAAAAFGHSVPVDAGMIGGGLAALYAAARLLARGRGRTRAVLALRPK